MPLNSVERQRLLGCRNSVAVGSMLMSLICLTVVAVLYLRLPELNQNKLICISETKLSEIALFLELKLLVDKKADDKYCFHMDKDATVLESVLKSSRTEGSLEGKRVIFGQVSAHHTLINPNGSIINSETLRFSPYIALNHNSEPESLDKEHTQNVEVMTLGYHIQHPGMYYVYSSLDPRSVTAELCDQLNKTWQHSVVLSSRDPLNSGTLLRGTHSCCSKCTVERTNSFIGGVFSLSAGDFLSVQVSDHRLLQLQADSSYFGLRRIGDGLP